MSQIISRTISSVVDKRLELANNSCARIMAIGSDWTHIRVGIRLAVNASANIASTPRLVIGLCKGITNIYGSATADHFVGWRSTQATWTYGDSPAFLGGAGGHTGQYVQRVGVVDVTASGAQPFRVISAPTTNRSCLFLDIEKNSPWDLQILVPTTTGAVQTDITETKFLEGMEVAAASLGNWVTGYGASTSGNLTVDEATDGYLDAVNISWDKSATPVELCDVAYTRFA